MSAYLPSDVNENLDDYFDLPDAGEDDDETYTIPCSFCGKPTTWDATYQNLCYRCISADSE